MRLGHLHAPGTIRHRRAKKKSLDNCEDQILHSQLVSEKPGQLTLLVVSESHQVVTSLQTDKIVMEVGLHTMSVGSILGINDRLAIDKEGILMITPRIYRGVWPQNVSKLAKYAVRFLDGVWKITVLYEAEAGLRYLAVEGGDSKLVTLINQVKTALRDQPGGAFYVNEYRHVIVPVRAEDSSGCGSFYYYAGSLESDFVFEFEKKPLTAKPIQSDGTPLSIGDPWFGPRPGIPYVLTAGGGDIYYKTPALTDTDPPTIRPMTIQHVKLSKVLKDRSLLMCAVKPLTEVRGHQGGRFYVNEYGAMFTPIGAGDGNGINYVYCGNIDPTAWFPEPNLA